jgi:hypothetical protein
VLLLLLTCPPACTLDSDCYCCWWLNTACAGCCCCSPVPLRGHLPAPLTAPATAAATGGSCSSYAVCCCFCCFCLCCFCFCCSPVPLCVHLPAPLTGLAAAAAQAHWQEPCCAAAAATGSCQRGCHLQALKAVNSGQTWSNICLLFWLLLARQDTARKEALLLSSRVSGHSCKASMIPVTQFC